MNQQVTNIPMTEIPRRQLMAAASGAVAATALALPWRALGANPATAATPTKSSFRYCLNMSTIRGQTTDVKKQIEVASGAGYDAVELWMGDLEKYQQAGNTLSDLKKRLSDAGLTVESAIGFANWIVDDPEQRKQGLEQAKRDMATLTTIGGKRIAAPPAGATSQADLDLMQAAARYRALLELGDVMGIVPQIECWGPSRSLSRLSEIVMVAIECGHPKACLLPDVYHLFRGGSSFHSLRMLDGRAIHVFHMNDYPDSRARTEMTDAHRVYPGDGVAPLTQILGDLKASGFNGSLSLELFNRDYWKQDALAVARTGLEKMKAAVAKVEA